MSVTTNRIRGRALQRIRLRTLTLNPLCVSCQIMGIVTPATQIDHIVALVNGGSDIQDNRQGLCDECHRLKTADDLGNKRRTGAHLNGMPSDPKHHWYSNTEQKQFKE